MKKTLLILTLINATLAQLRADVIVSEPFNYVNGSIIAVGTNTIGGTTNWFRHSGSANPSDAVVANKILQVSSSATGSPQNTALPRQDDINRPFTSDTNASIVVYASFTVNCTNLPPAVGTYFAHFYISSTVFHGRIYAQAGSLPGTWRLGIAGAAGTVSKVYPVDLATNVNYQVAVQWDPVTTYAATLWVNPIASSDFSVASIDTVATPPTVRGFGFRQSGSFGNFYADVTNLVVATTFEEASTNVWTTNAVAPIVAYQLKGGTNFPGETVRLSAVIAGQGLGNLTYQWRKDGSDITNPDGNTNVLTFPSAVIGDSGDYQIVGTTPYGLSVTSDIAFLWVTNSPIPPIITLQPSNTTVFFHQNAQLKVSAVGPPPLTYQWYYTNSPAVGANVSGADTDTLLITDVLTNNGTTGAYRCLVTDPYGTTTSVVATVSAVSPTSVTIAQLRTMVDPVFFLPTNTTALFSATGIVTTYTNITSTGNSSFYMQDGTGGINVFFGGAASVFPQAGDSVTVIGPLGNFNSLLELNLTTTDPAHSIVTNSSGNALPAPLVVAFNFTNTPSASNSIRFVQGARVTLTNVYFPAGFPGTNNFPSGGANVTVTNAAGGTFAVRVDSRVGDIIGKRIPPYGWTITGPMGFFLGTTETNRSAGFQLLPTRFVDLVSQKPASVTILGGNPVVSWLAGPNAPYSVWRAGDVEGPYAEIVSGLTFGTTSGQYTDTSAPITNAFYKITSP